MHVPESPAATSPAATSSINRTASYVELDDVGKAGDGKHVGISEVVDTPTTALKSDIRPIKRKGTQVEDVQDFFTSWWLVELSAWLLSAIALAALVALLATCDNKPLPQWPMDITLNSFVSILATIMKAGLVVPVAEGISQLKWLWFKKAGILKDIQTFDEASRGLWGSVKLILSTRGVHLAKLGALLTLILIAVDPFIQQIVAYPGRSIPSITENATVPVAYEYYGYSAGAIMALKEATLPMKAAVYAGLFDDNDDPTSDFEVSPNCPTGNCSWSQTYSSLGVCSQCANVTQSLNQSCYGETSDSYYYCNYTLPNGLTLDGIQRGGAYMAALGGGARDTVNFNGTQATIASLSTIRGLHDLSSTTLFGAVANECVLYACVNTYHSFVTSGNFTEVVVSSYTNSTANEVGSNVTLSPPMLDSSYTITGEAMVGMAQLLATLFTGTVTGDTGELYADNDAVRAIYELGTESGNGNQTNGENRTIEAVSKSMMRLMRTGSGYGYHTDTAVGVATMRETYVHVRWEWISLPVAVELIALIFLVGTIIRSKTSGVAIWKSSTLPLLHCRIVDEDQIQESPVSPAFPGREDGTNWGSGKLHELNKWALSSEVRLQRSDTGISEFVSRKRRKDTAV